MGMFDAAIPGQSLTQEKGASPVEYPPQFADHNHALEYLIEKMTQKKQVTRLVLLLKKGATVEYIARAIVFQGFTAGKWTPDTGTLILRVVMAMIIAIAANAGIKDPKILNPDKGQDEFLDEFIDDVSFDTGSDEDELDEEIMPEATQLPEFTGILGSVA